MTAKRPTVHCLAAKMIGSYVIGVPIVVSLETAGWLKSDYGWAIVGPDIHDSINLAAWEREHEPVT